MAVPGGTKAAITRTICTRIQKANHKWFGLAPTYAHTRGIPDSRTKGDDPFALANDTEHGLAAYVYTNSLKTTLRAEASTVVFKLMSISNQCQFDWSFRNNCLFRCQIVSI